MVALVRGLGDHHRHADQTLIAGPVTDQAALHGLLVKIRDLGLPLLSVRRIDPGQ
jgi:cytosine/adenosine deaminase-related metal-dependent hydrolase